MRKLVAALAFACATTLPATAQTVQERLPTCLACHGENGQSQNPDVPSLGAQQAFYVTVQLLLFRERMRIADPMNDMAKGLSDDDLRSFADIIAKLPAPHPLDAPADDARIERARALVAQNSLQRALPTNARIISSRRCVATRIIPATVMTLRWRRSCSRSPTIRFWTSPITSRG